MQSLVLALMLASTAGVEVPANDGWVTDPAGLLSASAERELESLMESYRQGSGHEIAALIIRSLDGDAIEPFALRVARDWKIGREGENDGALLVVVVEDRAMRIEVGRGLEGTLTDSICGRIIRDVIAPRFRASDYDGGILAGVKAMHRAAGGDYGALPARDSGRGGGSGVATILIVLVFLFLLSRTRRRGPGARRGFGGAPPWIFTSGPGYRGGSHGGFGGGGFGGFGGGGGFSGGGATGGW